MLASMVSHQCSFGAISSFAALDGADLTFDAKAEMLRLLFGIHLLG